MLEEYLKKPVFIYILEFISATIVCYALYVSYPQHRLIWAMTSVSLVLTPRSEHSRALIYSRIKANLLGVFTGLLIMMIHKPGIIVFCVGAVLAILLSRMFNIMDSVRSALVALIVIMIPEYRESSYVVALERVVCVITGCVIALIVTYLFDFVLLKLSEPDRGKVSDGRQDSI
jgi:uncharacterized membrane protein YccC